LCSYNNETQQQQTKEKYKMEKACRHDYPNVTDGQWATIISQPHRNLHDVVTGYTAVKEELKRSADRINDGEESVNLLPSGSWYRYVCDNGTGHELVVEDIDDILHNGNHDLGIEEELYAIYFDG
jgi:hypothetical protein